MTKCAIYGLELPASVVLSLASLIHVCAPSTGTPHSNRSNRALLLHVHTSKLFLSTCAARGLGQAGLIVQSGTASGSLSNDSTDDGWCWVRTRHACATSAVLVANVRA